MGIKSFLAKHKGKKPNAPTYVPPAEVSRAVTLAESVRDHKLFATNNHLVLGGQLDQRASEVMGRVNRDEYDAAQLAVDQLRDDLNEEKRLRDEAKKKYDDDKAALEQGSLASVPSTAPAGLESSFQAIGSARSALPSDPKTLEEYQQANLALAELKSRVTQFLAKKKNLDDGSSKFGSTGSKLAELTGHDKLNDLQKSILDEKLKKKLAESDVEMSEQQLKELAQRIVNKTNKLAETPLSADTNTAISKSETLKNNIVTLQNEKWTIVYGASGGGSYCDKQNRQIVMDPDDPLDEALGGLAHETGHALFTPPPKPSLADATDGAEYVRKCIEVDFLDEGEAQLMACRAKKQLDEQGTVTQVPADTGEFEIYKKYEKGEITEDAARKEMAKKFGNLVTSTTHESYLVYYGKFAINQWNAANPDRTVTPDILDSMTLFA